MIGSVLPVQEATPGQGPSALGALNVQPLPRRQGQVLRLIMAGETNKTIGRQLGMAEGSVKCAAAAAALFRKFNVQHRAALAALGSRFLREE